MSTVWPVWFFLVSIPPRHMENLQSVLQLKHSQSCNMHKTAIVIFDIVSPTMSLEADLRRCV
jgi:hypothetical protein